MEFIVLFEMFYRALIIIKYQQLIKKNFVQRLETIIKQMMTYWYFILGIKGMENSYRCQILFVRNKVPQISLVPCDLFAKRPFFCMPNTGIVLIYILVQCHLNLFERKIGKSIPKMCYMLGNKYVISRSL